MCNCREEIYTRYAAVSIQSGCIRLNSLNYNIEKEMKETTITLDNKFWTTECYG